MARVPRPGWRKGVDDVDSATLPSSPGEDALPSSSGLELAAGVRRDSDVREAVAGTQELESGNVIADKYRLVSRLSEGGMGSLWIAHNEPLDVQVALKVIRTDIKGHEDAKLGDRLLVEARATARLGHPAIVRTLDFGKTEAGAPYIVMELLAGEDLAMALDRRGRISPKKAIQTLLPIAHALSAAHDKEIVHRDLKPENIFLATNESGRVQPKLIDFGVAKLDKPTSERLTAIGTMMGSPGYMSPEQARGDDVDYRADQWAFCIVLYEMISGRLPFHGKNFNALMRSIIEDECPPITSFRAGDEDLWLVLARGLAKDPDMRWASMHALGVALAQWLIARDVTEDICSASLEAVWLSTSRGNMLSSIPPPASMQPDSLEPRWNETMPVGSEATVTPVPTVGSTPLPGTPAVPPPDPSNPETTSPGRLSLPELAAEASLHGARISLVDEAQQKDSRFRMLVLAGAVVLAIIGGIGVWRLTAPADDGTATNPDANATSAPTNATPTATPTPPATATATATATASAKATATATASAKATPKSTTRKPSRPPTVARPPRTTTSKPASGPQLKKPTFD